MAVLKGSFHKLHHSAVNLKHNSESEEEGGGVYFARPVDVKVDGANVYVSGTAYGPDHREYFPADQEGQFRTPIVNALYHYPLLDLDCPIRLVPSSTHGHHHLMIEREVPHEAYEKLLEALVECNLLEPGNLYRFRKDGVSVIRKPEVKKDSQADSPRFDQIIGRSVGGGLVDIGEDTF